jgi:hypothetical protein
MPRKRFFAKCSLRLTVIYLLDGVWKRHFFDIQLLDQGPVN